MTRAFITGGAGFIGSTLVQRLLRGTDCFITVYDNFSSGDPAVLSKLAGNGRLSVIEADLLDHARLPSSIKGHDIVYHFASNPDIARGIEDPSLDYRQSIQCTFHLLEAMRQASVSKLLFTSGSGVYGDAAGEFTPENFGPLLPVSMYGAGKLGAEALISAFSHMFGFQTWIFRMANVVGKNQTHGVILDFVEKLRRNPRELIVLGDGKQSKSYIDVDDVLDAFEFVLSRATAPVNLFNLATCDYVSVDEIAQVVVEEMGLPAPVLRHTGGERGWPGDVPKVRIETSKLRGLGFEPKLTSREAVRKAAREIVARKQEEAEPE